MPLKPVCPNQQHSKKLSDEKTRPSDKVLSVLAEAHSAEETAPHKAD